MATVTPLACLPRAPRRRERLQSLPWACHLLSCTTWKVLITPHVAVYGAPYRQKWEAMLLENYRRFAAGEPLLNVADKRKWY